MALQGSTEIILLALIKDIKGLERHRAPGMMCAPLTPPEIPLSRLFSLHHFSFSCLCCRSVASFLLVLNHHFPPSPPTHTLTPTSFLCFHWCVFHSLTPLHPVYFISFPLSLFSSVFASLSVSISFFPSLSRKYSPPLPRSWHLVTCEYLH